MNFRPFAGLGLVLLVLPGCPDAITDVDETLPPATFGATPTQDPDGGTPQPVDFTGTWAYRTQLTQHVENAFDSSVYDVQTVKSYYVLTHEAGASANELIFKAKLCQTDLSEVSGSMTTIDPGFYTNTPVVPYVATLSKRGVGGTYTVEEFTELRGVELDNPMGTLPKAPDTETDCDDVDDTYLADQGVYDYDGDGNQGFTIDVDGAVNATLWAIERLTLGLSGTIYSEDRIEGYTSGLLEDVFICSTKPGLVSTDVDVYPDTEAENNFFQMVRVADGFTCDQVVAQKDDLF